MIYTYTISIYLNLKYIYLKQNYISSFNHKLNRKSPDCIQIICWVLGYIHPGPRVYLFKLAASNLESQHPKHEVYKKQYLFVIIKIVNYTKHI